MRDDLQKLLKDHFGGIYNEKEDAFIEKLKEDLSMNKKDLKGELIKEIDNMQVLVQLLLD